MSLYTITNTEELPLIKKPAGLDILESTDVALLSFLGNTTEADVVKRLANDHLAFVAYMNHQPAGFGWMARGKAKIGELNHTFILPRRNRYLWNFRTLAEYRGLGIYPALLQFIIRYEGWKANRFWIIHAPENKSSLKGIAKAGFQYVGNLYTKVEGTVTLEANTVSDTLRPALEFMNIQLSSEVAASCWNCSSPYLKKRIPVCCCSEAGHECTDNRILALAS